ncbi:MAG: anthranilate synthase component I family protein, partial [Chitinophagaceae bacterium]
MRKIEINTTCKKMLADVFTPVGIYLRLRDRFRDTILLESTDFHSADNSYSFIGINAIAGIEISSVKSIDFKLPGQNPEKAPIQNSAEVPKLLWDFMQRFQANPCSTKEGVFAQGLFGYTTYDAVQFFDTIKLKTNKTDQNSVTSSPAIPLMRYRLYQYVIAINHFKDELFICENKVAGVESDLAVLESIIRSKDIPAYPFGVAGTESSNMTDDDYTGMVKK